MPESLRSHHTTADGRTPRAQNSTCKAFLHHRSKLCWALAAQARQCAKTDSQQVLCCCFHLFCYQSSPSGAGGRQSFIATLDRFAAHLGAPIEVFSDNGSNFLGAQAELRDLYHMIREKSKEQVIHWASVKGIRWHFSPGRAPHFGGLWEAAVRSMKVLLRKVVGEHTLRWDEILTVLTTAEATINSRPITAIDAPSTDGVAPLTLGHFLVGRPLCALPSIPDEHSKIQSLRHWNLTQTLTSELWRRWRAEYLTQLQRCNKWKRPMDNLQVGDLVFLKDADTFQRTWPMGRIVTIYPGSDGKVRAVDLTFNNKVYRRSILKLLGEEEFDAPSRECSGQHLSLLKNSEL